MWVLFLTALFKCLSRQFEVQDYIICTLLKLYMHFYPVSTNYTFEKKLFFQNTAPLTSNLKKSKFSS